MKLFHGLLAGCLACAILAVPSRSQTKASATTNQAKAVASATALAPVTIPVVNELRGVAPGRYPLKNSAGAPIGEIAINGNGTMDVGKLFAQKAGGGDTACSGSPSDDEKRRKLLEELDKAIKEVVDSVKQTPPKSADKSLSTLGGMLRSYCGAAFAPPAPEPQTRKGIRNSGSL